MMKIISGRKNESCVQLQKGLAARAKTNVCKDNKNKESRLSVIIVFISYVKNSLANKVIWHCVEYFFFVQLLTPTSRFSSFS